MVIFAVTSFLNGPKWEKFSKNKVSLGFLFHLPLHFLFFERFFSPRPGGGALLTKVFIIVSPLESCFSLKIFSFIN